MYARGCDRSVGGDVRAWRARVIRVAKGQCRKGLVGVVREKVGPVLHGVDGMELCNVCVRAGRRMMMWTRDGRGR